MHITPEKYHQGKPWATFLAEMSQNRERLLRVLDAVRLRPEDVRAAQEAAAGKEKPLRILVLTEDWCPDAIVNIPVVYRLAEALPGTHLRFFYRSEHPDLAEAYAAEGIHSIPVVSIFDGRWRDIVRWVEHSRAAQERKTAWMAQYPDAERWRTSDDPEDQRQWRALVGRRFVAMVRWYREEGLWRATWEELLAALREGRESPAG